MGILPQCLHSLTDSPASFITSLGSFGCTQPQQIYVKVDSRINKDGARIDLTPEQKAAKVSLQAEAGLPGDLVQALYQAPGSQ